MRSVHCNVMRGFVLFVRLFFFCFFSCGCFISIASLSCMHFYAVSFILILPGENPLPHKRFLAEDDAGNGNLTLQDATVVRCNTHMKHTWSDTKQYTFVSCHFAKLQINSTM